VFEELLAKFEEYASSAYPNEVGAVIVGDELQIVINTHDSPTTNFRGRLPDDYDFFIHSHTIGDAKDEFSETDKRSQKLEARPWLLYYVEGRKWNKLQ